MEQQKDYFLSCMEDNQFIIYDSEKYRLNELDILNLIKICFINERSKSIGKKILDIYKDSTKDREHLTIKRLNSIGLKIDLNEKQPTKRKKVESR